MQAGSDMGRWWLTVTLSVSTRTGMVSMTYRSKRNHRQQRQELRYEMDGSNALAKAFVVAILFWCFDEQTKFKGKRMHHTCEGVMLEIERCC